MGKKKASGMARKLTKPVDLLRRYMGKIVALDMYGDGCLTYGKIRDATNDYGRERVQFQPHAGEGLTWVDVKRITKTVGEEV